MMMHDGVSAKSAGRWTRAAVPGIVLVLGVLSLVSFVGFDRQIVSVLARGRVHSDVNQWVEAFTRLGKAWFQIWLLLVWFVISRRRQDVLAGLLALILVGLLVNPVKVAVGRSRPRAVLEAQMTGQLDPRFAEHLSFPSGDTAAAFAVTTAVLPAFGWPVRLVLLGASAGIGGLRVMATAHYPSDVFAGAALGLLAGWLAIRLVTRWDLARRPLPFENELILAGLTGIPISVGLSEGPAELMLLLRTYGLVALGIFLTVRIRARLKTVGAERILSFLATWRLAAVALAFVVVLVENVVHAKRPHELLSVDQPVSAMALLGFTLVIAGAGLRLWGLRRGARGTVLVEEPHAIVRHLLHIAALAVVCGLLLQLNDWMNWLVVMPVFTVFYGASLLHEAKTQGRRQASGPATAPTFASSLFHLRPSLPDVPVDWRRARLFELGTTLAIVCLPLIIELVVEDLVFERLLGA